MIDRRLWLGALGVAGAVLLAAAACGEADRDQDRAGAALKVVTTLPLLADFVREVGGERVEVFALLPSGADPHTYEPVPRDVQRITEADLVFVNGFHLEPAALKVIQPNLSPGAPLIELAEEAGAAGVEIIGGGESQDGEGDPHLWLDIDNARTYAGIIRDSLAGADPEGAEAYEDNYQRYLDELADLNRYVLAKVSTVPAERRKLVTTHDAFGYLARYLGFQVAAFVVAGPGQEPSAADVADLAKAIKSEGVPAVFEEPQLGAAASVLERAAADAGVQVCTLYSDGLDDRVRTYVELMRFNADEMARCLGGDARG